jgi:two-component system chemotaxis response regulator CheB
MLIEDKATISLSKDEKVNFSRPSIDVLFETAAEVYGSNLTGIILTGANNDGSRGLKIIKDFGGNTIVQDPKDAETKEMPESAIKLAKVDKILNSNMLADFFKNIE